MEKPSDGKSPHPTTRGKLIAFDKLHVKNDLDDEMFSYKEEVLSPPTEAEFNSTFRCQFSCCRDGVGHHSHNTITGAMDEETADAFLNHPPQEIMPNPVTLQNIRAHQLNDERLMQLADTYPLIYPVKQFDEHMVICYCPDPFNQPNSWQYYLPDSLVQQVIVWYHLVLGHRGTQLMYHTINRRFYNRGLKRKVESLKCEICQMNKPINAQYGHLPEQHADLVLWYSVAVDLIGPWKITINGVVLKFNALTCIDPVSNLMEQRNFASRCRYF